MRSTPVKAIFAIAVAMVVASSPTTIAAQTQLDLDAIAKSCGLPTGRLVIKNDHILLFASPNDPFVLMGCIRADINKIPGAAEKLGVVMWDKHKAKAR